MIPSLAKLTVNTDAPRCEWPLDGASGNPEWNNEWIKRTAAEAPPELKKMEKVFNTLLKKLANDEVLTDVDLIAYSSLESEIERLKFYSSHMAIRVRRDGNCFYHSLATLLRVPSMPGVGPDGSPLTNPYDNLPKTINGVVLRAQVMQYMQREYEHFGSDAQLAGELGQWVKKESDADFAARHAILWSNKELHPDLVTFCTFLEQEVTAERNPPRDMTPREVVDFYVQRFGRLGDFAGQCEADAAAELFDVHIIMLMLNVDPANPTQGTMEAKADRPEWLQAWGEAWPCKKSPDGTFVKRTPEEIAQTVARFKAANAYDSPTADDAIRDDMYGGASEYTPLSPDEARALPTLIMVRHFPDNDPRYEGDIDAGISEAPHFSPIIPKNNVGKVVRKVPECSLDLLKPAARLARSNYVSEMKMYAMASGRLPDDEDLLRVGCKIGYCSDVAPEVRDMILDYIAMDVFGMPRVRAQGKKRRLGGGESSAQGESSGAPPPPPPHPPPGGKGGKARMP
jgi:hypothetical protein